MTVSTSMATIISSTLALPAKESKSKKESHPKNTLIEEVSMNNRYNYCSRCGQWMGWFNWFKFWQKPQVCEECERRQL